METESDFSVHMAAATSMSWEMLLVELPSVLPHGGKSWYFLSYFFPSHAQALSWAHRAASSLWGGQGCHWSPGAQGAAPGSRAAHSIWQDRGDIRLLIRSDKRHLSTQQQGPSHKEGLCSVLKSHCQCCGVPMTQLPSHRGDAAASTAIVKLHKQHQ